MRWKFLNVFSVLDQWLSPIRFGFLFILGSSIFPVEAQSYVPYTITFQKYESYVSAHEKLLSSKSSEVGKLCKLRHASVVVANYKLIQEHLGEYDEDLKEFDFSHKEGKERFDKWILDRFAYISETQKELGEKAGVNTEITDAMADCSAGIAKMGYRPPQSGRAMVIPVVEKHGPGVESRPVADIKGVGARAPADGHYRNGLLSLGEAIREYAWEHLVRMILGKIQLTTGTLKEQIGIDGVVGTYAVIYTGFKIKRGNYEDPAALMIRQAHFRHLQGVEDPGDKRDSTKLSGNGWLPGRQRFQMDMLFNFFGIETGYNVQGTLSTKENYRYLFDLGHYVVVPKYIERQTKIKREIFAGYEQRMDDYNWVYPDLADHSPNPILTIPGGQWGFVGASGISMEDYEKLPVIQNQVITKTMTHYSVMDILWSEAHTLARNFVNSVYGNPFNNELYHKSREEVDAFIEGKISSARERINNKDADQDLKDLMGQILRIKPKSIP